MQSQVRFNRGSGEGSGEGLEGFGAEPGQVQQGSGEGSGKGVGGFGAETRSGSTGFRRMFLSSTEVPEKVRRSGRLWCRARSGSTGFRRRFGEGLGGFGAEPGQVQQRFRRRFRRRSGRLWCRARSGSTEVPEKVPEKVWEALVQSQVRFNRGSGEGSGKGLGGFGAEPGQVQQNSGEGSGEGLGGFGAEPGQVQQRFWRRFRRRSGRLWCRARSGSTEVPEKVPEKVWKALVQSQVRFNRVPEKVPEKVWEALVQKPGQVQQGSGECS